jgi:hypothetical protein
MKKSDFVYDAAKNTATISVDFAKKSSNVHSVEYRFLINERQKNPTMTIVIRTHDSGNRLTYKDMETRLRRIDKNGKLVEAFKLVKEIAKTESSPYAYVYNWYKAQMDTVKAEKESEKKASASNTEEMKKKLAELTAGISLDTSVDVEEMEMEEEIEEEKA